MNASDLFDMYQTNYPMLRLEDFERIVEDYHLWYDCEEDTTNQTFKPDGNKENDPQILGIA